MSRVAMVLGAVRDEVPLVEAFRSMGYEVIVVGKGSNYPCCNLADRYYDVDIKNKTKLLEIAQIEGVSAVSSNIVSIAVSSTAWLAEQLGLPGIGYDTAMRFTNKYTMRQAAEKAGVGCPPYALARTKHEALEFASAVGYPLVMKPVDGNSSRGVFKLGCDEDIDEHFDECLGEALSDRYVLMEGFIKGQEYIVDSFCSNGMCVNTDVGYKEHFAVEGKFISKAVVIQDAAHCQSDIEQKLLEANKRTVEALGLPYGPTHGEYIYNPDDHCVYLVEVAARGGGIRLSSDLIPLATGVQVSELLARYATGEDPFKGSGLELHEGAAAWFAFSLPDGVISSICGVDECARLGAVDYFDLDDLVVGVHAKTLKDDGGKYGPLVVHGRTRDDCFVERDRVKALFDVAVDGRMGCPSW